MIFIPLGPPYGSLLTYIIKSSNIFPLMAKSSYVLIFFSYIFCVACSLPGQHGGEEDCRPPRSTLMTYI